MICSESNNKLCCCFFSPFKIYNVYVWLFDLKIYNPPGKGGAQNKCVGCHPGSETNGKDTFFIHCCSLHGPYLGQQFYAIGNNTFHLRLAYRVWI